MAFHGDGNPPCAYLVAILKAILGELYGIEEDEQVTLTNLVEESHVRKMLGLMDSYHISSFIRNSSKVSA